LPSWYPPFILLPHKPSHTEAEAGGTGELKEVHVPANLKVID